MEYLKIRNWDRWQTYRADRGQPPWIKIHRRIMRNPEWVSMTDAERGQLVAMWLLAADRDGVIPTSPELIQKLCFMTKPPNLSKFMGLGWIETNDAIMTPDRRQHDHPKAEAKAEAKAETEAETPDRRQHDNHKFLQFWKAYPRKVGKIPAEKAYSKIPQSKEQLQIILEAIKEQEKSYQWTKNKGEFIPNPATWLNQGRWEDELDGTKAEAALKLPYSPTMDIEKLDGTEKHRDVSKLISGLKEM